MYSKLTLRIAAAWIDHVPGGKADDKIPDDFDSDALARGIAVESEHTYNPELAEEIAMDHLTEFPGVPESSRFLGVPDYYTALERMENELKQQVSTHFTKK